MNSTELPFNLEGRVAVVTGGGTGIGAATARLLASFGADIVISSRKTEVLESAAKELATETGRVVRPITCDVRDEAACQGLIETTVGDFGKVDILVNNAGGGYMNPFVTTDVKRFDNSLNLNLRAPYVLTQAVAPHMAQQGGGTIVNISSIGGVTGLRGGAAYSTAKAGLQMLTRVVAAELGPLKIRCNAIAVGETGSEGALRAWAKFGESAESVGQRFPLRRVGSPLDIAWGVFYLSTEMSSWVTGETITIAGGPVLTGGLSEKDLNQATAETLGVAVE